MALIRTRAPSARDLRWFGAILLALFGLIGAIVFWRSGSLRVAALVWSVGAASVLVYYALRPLRHPIYRGFMSLVAPVGWVVTHLLLGVVFYGLMMPIGLLLRVFSCDPMRRGLESAAESYWTPRKASRSERYFRQY